MRVRGDTGILAGRSGCLEYILFCLFTHNVVSLGVYSLLPLARCSTSHVSNELYLIIYQYHLILFCIIEFKIISNTYKIYIYLQIQRVTHHLKKAQQDRVGPRRPLLGVVATKYETVELQIRFEFYCSNDVHVIVGHISLPHYRETVMKQ